MAWKKHSRARGEVCTDPNVRSLRAGTWGAVYGKLVVLPPISRRIGSSASARNSSVRAQSDLLPRGSDERGMRRAFLAKQATGPRAPRIRDNRQWSAVSSGPGMVVWATGCGGTRGGPAAVLAEKTCSRFLSVVRDGESRLPERRIQRPRAALPRRGQPADVLAEMVAAARGRQRLESAVRGWRFVTDDSVDQSIRSVCGRQSHGTGSDTRAAGRFDCDVGRRVAIRRCCRAGAEYPRARMSSTRERGHRPLEESSTRSTVRGASRGTLRAARKRLAISAGRRSDGGDHGRPRARRSRGISRQGARMANLWRSSRELRENLTRLRPAPTSGCARR